MLADDFIDYLISVRRYTPRTCGVYRANLDRFLKWAGVSSDGADASVKAGLKGAGKGLPPQDEALLGALTQTQLRNYEVHLMADESLSPRSVSQHISALSSLCRYLMKRGLLKENAGGKVRRPKVEKRLPHFYRDESLEAYFRDTAWSASPQEWEALAPHCSVGCLKGNKVLDEAYRRRLSRLIISLLYGTGIRRAELISLTVSSFDASRRILRVRGKGDKMREIPVTELLCEEIFLYLKAVEAMVRPRRDAGDPLLLTPSGSALYPSFVDRTVKQELSGVKGVSGRKSPHVLRHSLATELLSQGAGLNSIKEMLGHSSLAATQVYTHSTVAQLGKVYQTAHPRAKKRR